MKKITIRKGGFTLTEIILVVAIILILSSAAFVGVAVTLNRADTMKYNLSVGNGNNFEASAWATVKNLTYGEGGYLTQATYEPEETEESLVPPQSDNESTTPEEVVQYDAVANDEIQDLLNAGVSRKDIWVIRDDDGNITGWSWYSVGDPELSADLSDETRASIASHRITSRPTTTVTTSNNGNSGGGNQQQHYENYENNNNNNNNNNQTSSEPVTVGNCSIPSGYNKDMDNGVGVSNATDLGNGSYSIDVHSSNNAATLTIVPNGKGGYTFTISGNQWMLQGMPSYGDNGYNDFAQTRDITQADLEWIQNKWGFEIKD